MENLKQVLMNRDSLKSEEADEMIKNAQEMVIEFGEEPEEILLDEFGLEPDYIFDLLDY